MAGAGSCGVMAVASWDVLAEREYRDGARPGGVAADSGVLAGRGTAAQAHRVSSGTRGAAVLMRAWLVAGAALAACEGEPASADDAGAKVERPRAGETAGDDGDGDGLCDTTETEFSTEPRAWDTDGDGISDLIEVAHGLGERDPLSPPAERVIVLGGRAGSTVEFEVRVTVTGDGAGQMGAFEREPAVYDDARSAGDYFGGAVALSAEPNENVRGIDPDAEKFSSVTGTTRLAFSLRFVTPVEREAPKCVRGYPFRYTVRSSLGDELNTAPYLLVVVPEDSSFTDGPWCGLEPCL